MSDTADEEKEMYRRTDVQDATADMATALYQLGTKQLPSIFQGISVMQMLMLERMYENPYCCVYDDWLRDIDGREAFFIVELVSGLVPYGVIKDGYLSEIGIALMKTYKGGTAKR